MNKEYLKNWEKKKILILGFAREGMDTLLFLRKIFPKKIIGIADQNKLVKDKKLKNIKWHLGKNYLESIKKYDIIIKSPGIKNEIVFPYLKKESLLTSQTDIFFHCYPGTIIGVTGTKGKGTVSLLIFYILREGKKRVKIGGNIEKPVLKYLFSAKKDDFFVYELSSHQLVNLKISPKIAVLLNITPAHLDFFKNFNSYKKTKANICLWQNKNDYLIYNSKDKEIKKIIKKSKAKKIAFDKKAKEKLSLISRNPLLGKFNQLNILAAITVAQVLKISKNAIKKGIEKFKPLPHRLQFIGNFKGIDFYNDSQATVPEATIAAIDALKKSIYTLIAGGYDSKVDYKKLGEKIAKSKIKILILFQPTGQKIWRETKKRIKRKILTFFVNSMKEAVQKAFELTPKGKTCLLSPAAPSFGIFKNYKERGNLFIKFVKQYGKKRK